MLAATVTFYYYILPRAGATVRNVWIPHTQVLQLHSVMCDYDVLTICCSLSFLQAARAVWSLVLETAWGNTRQRSITDRHFWNSSFILSRSSSHRVSWDEHRQLEQKHNSRSTMRLYPLRPDATYAYIPLRPGATFSRFHRFHDIWLLCSVHDYNYYESAPRSNIFAPLLTNNIE